MKLIDLHFKKLLGYNAWVYYHGTYTYILTFKGFADGEPGMWDYFPHENLLRIQHRRPEGPHTRHIPLSDALALLIRMKLGI